MEFLRAPRTPWSLVFFSLLTLWLATPTTTLAFRGTNDWMPVDPAHLALKTPVVEKEADAEAIFWEVKVADEAEGNMPRTVLDHYLRIKIFTERGRESQSKIDIPFFGRIKIRDIAGRTIKPDGTIIELKKDDIFERTIIKASGLKLKAKSFAMPGVEPGAIIEYRWREQRGNTFSNYEDLHFSREIPVQLVKYYIKPFAASYFPYSMRAQPFHCHNTPFVKEKNGYYSTTMANVPAFREEPRMPPEKSVRPWLLIYYTEDKKLEPQKFWKQIGKDVYEESKSSIKANDEVKKAAAEIIGDAPTPEKKLERLFDYCRHKIKNINDDALGLSAEERDKIKENKSPSDTLKRGTGNGHDINRLFAALANAAGFEARVARLGDRGYAFFDASFTDTYLMPVENIAVRVGDGWRFYDPASVYIPHGMLRWQEEGQPALISDPKEANFVETPLSTPQKSLERRIAKLRLDEEGTLEGEVYMEFYGHAGVEQKEFHDDDSPAEREETLRSRLKARMSSAEISEVRIENVTDPVKPLIYAYKVRVPGYAERTGKRLFLQPAFFQRGLGPLFPTSERRHMVYFNYPWSEQDNVEIILPAGYNLDNADAPATFGSGDMSQYSVKLSATTDGRVLIYKRSFFFGGGKPDGLNRLLFPVETYANLKKYFDVVHKQDSHTLSLKQGAPPPASTGTAN